MISKVGFHELVLILWIYVWKMGNVLWKWNWWFITFYISQANSSQHQIKINMELVKLSSFHVTDISFLLSNPKKYYFFLFLLIKSQMKSTTYHIFLLAEAWYKNQPSKNCTSERTSLLTILLPAESDCRVTTIFRSPPKNTADRCTIKNILIGCNIGTGIQKTTANLMKFEKQSAVCLRICRQFVTIHA